LIAGLSNKCENDLESDSDMDVTQPFDSPSVGPASNTKSHEHVNRGAESLEIILAHAWYPLWRKHLVVTLARARKLQDAGNDVTVTYYNANGGTCAVNFNGNPVAWPICKARVRCNAEAAGLKTVGLDAEGTEKGSLPVLRLSEMRSVVEGVNSGVIFAFRTMPEQCGRPAILDRVRPQCFHSASRVLKSMKRLVASKQPDEIEVFNGRHVCTKSAVIAAESTRVPFNTLDHATVVHMGHLVHDRKGIQPRIQSQPVDMEVAKDFYETRRSPRGNKFAKKHKIAFVPRSKKSYVRCVIVFVSSQNEFASLGEEWVSPVLDYAPVVHRPRVSYPGTMFCIRFHPNQADVASDIVPPLESTGRPPSTQIYHPTDQVNSYQLMDWSDVIVTFGSTISIEACCAEKPVVMLGPSYFDELEVSYHPASIDEFAELLRGDLHANLRGSAARVADHQRFEKNPLRYKLQGKRLEPDGFRVRHLLHGRLARCSNDIFCSIVKARAKRSRQPSQRKAA
jgi:hypothetical protein